MTNPGGGRYVVQGGDSARVAAAVVRYQIGRPQFWNPMLAIVVGVALLGGRSSAGTAAAGAVLCLVLIAGVVLFKRRQLASTLAARGFRPGTTITAEFGPDELSLTADGGSGRHPYTDIADVRRYGDVVLLRRREARMVLTLPAELVPAQRLQALRAAP